MISVEQGQQENMDILNLMKESKIYWQVKREIISAITKAQLPHKPSIQPSIEQILKTLINTDNEDKINGLITNCLQKSTRRLPIQNDGNPEVQIYRVKWSQMISKEFNNISNRIIRNQEYDQEDESVNYTYDCGSLLQFLSSLKISTKEQFGIRSSREEKIFLFKENLIPVSTYQQLRNKYAFLMQSENLLGDLKDTDIKDRERKAMKIVDGENIASQIENYLCLGSVNTERVNVYSRYFECFYEYSGKRVDWSLYEKVWKPIMRLDCKEILKDPQYFVFKEELEKVYKQFVCDKQVGQMLKIRQLSPNTELDKYSPIHHVLPCKSFSTYMAPFCYTSQSAQEIYQLFRSIYCNYFINLHVISSQSDSILGLCILFEELLSSTQKKLVLKFQQLNIQPLRIVFPWIFYSFIGYIHVEQFFLMLDRIIGTKSMDILPLYAIAVLFKCKGEILQAKNQAQIIQILYDTMKDDVWIQTLRDFFKYHL